MDQDTNFDQSISECINAFYVRNKAFSVRNKEVYETAQI